MEIKNKPTITPVLSAEGIHKKFLQTEVLHGIDIAINPHEFTLITGPSGSGKTTILNVMSGIERPDSGSVHHGDVELGALSDEELTTWRGQNTGYAFQRSGLLGGLTAGENIVAPHKLMENKLDREWAGQLCARLGIRHLLGNPANSLSGGEKQRVAIARSLVHQPSILFADEPSAALDSHAKVEIHNMLRELVDESGVSIAMVSHDQISVDYADTVVRLQDGRVTTQA